MPQIPSKEGTITWDVPGAGKTCNTWYKVIGDLSNGKSPLISLHGGPGCCHEYLLNNSLLTERFGIPTIFYDQLGNGKSTRLPEKNGDESFWTEELFRRELDVVVEHFGLHERQFDVLGQSWGTMLASSWASGRPKGLRRLVLSSPIADAKDWMVAAKILQKRLPQDAQDVLKRCEEEGTTDSKEYERAMDVYYANFLCNVKPWPAEAEIAVNHLKEDATVYGTMWGPSEIMISGSLRDWTVKDRMHSIEVPVLLLNGIDDESQPNVVNPFFRGIKRVRWFTFDSASHMVNLEQPEKYIQVLSEFLLEDES